MGIILFAENTRKYNFFDYQPSYAVPAELCNLGKHFFLIMWQNKKNGLMLF